jgi:hypothetical protein
MADAAPSHESFIDWMKATGMVLILIGHVYDGHNILFNSVTAPIYTKQLGVAFFVFIAGWGLAHNTRGGFETSYRRLFELLLFGALCALFMSAVTWFQKGDLAESNYLPLMLGANVFLNHFPANPTTWYIGMYTQLILLWWLLVPRRVSPWVLLPVLLAEIGIRALILEAGRPFTAYMMVSNWMSVFLLGYLLAGLRDRVRPAIGLALLALWLAALLVWQTLHHGMAFDSSFPTRYARGTDLPMAVISVLVSALYLVNTLFAFFVFRRFRAPWPVRFIARHTLLIFILHMPLIYASAKWVYSLSDDFWVQRSSLIVGVLLALCLVSELVHRVLPTQALRDGLWARIARFRGA